MFPLIFVVSILLSVTTQEDILSPSLHFLSLSSNKEADYEMQLALLPNVAEHQRLQLVHLIQHSSH